MPQDFLRDVLRTGDASGRARRRLSVLPVSIAAHAMAIALFVMSPLTTGVDMPAISSPLEAARYMPTITPPSPPPPQQPPSVRAESTAAPTQAPDRIMDEPPSVPTNPVEGALPPGPGIDTGASVLSNLNVAGPPPAPPSPPPPPTPVRPGTRGIREPKKIVHVAPEYPVMALRARKEGTVILEAILDVTGRVDRLKVLKSEALLDEAAIRAVQQWRYTPTELNGVPVPVLMTITVRFSLSQE
jgi:protein TonB